MAAGVHEKFHFVKPNQTDLGEARVSGDLESRNDAHKHAMNPSVCGELWMESGGHCHTLPNQGWETLTVGQGFHPRPNFDNTRGTNKDHLQRSAGKAGFHDLDAGVDLPAVGVALDHCIKKTQASLGGIADLAGQQNGSGTGTEDRPGPAKFLQSLKEVALFQEFEHRGRFAAGQHEAVDLRKLFRLANFVGLGARFRESLGVGGVVALDGEDADAGLLRPERPLGFLFGLETLHNNNVSGCLYRRLG